ncbi:MAG: ADP-ribosylglycohydrolase family protein [Polyangiales bacterium]
MTTDDRLEATLLGTAVGDALGLVAEGLSPKTIARRFGRVDRYHLLGRTGFVSDDTEQSALVAQSLARHPDDPAACARAFRRSLLGWFLRLPWGVGLATVRACVRIALGLSRSGVDSAGNGAAMRAAVVGAFIRDPLRRRATSDALARVTHTDPRAVEGARYVAEVAAAPRELPAADACRAALAVVDDASLRAALERGLALAVEGADTHVAARELGTTGFVVHTLGFATFAFVRWANEPLRALQEVVAAGGDTDSIGAIVGAWNGALRGLGWAPKHLLDDLQGGPFGAEHLRALAADLARGGGLTARYSPLAAMARNLALYPVVLAHGFRRLIPW